MHAPTASQHHAIKALKRAQTPAALSPSVLAGSLRLIEFVALTFAGFAAQALYLPAATAPEGSYTLAIVLGAALYTFLAQAPGLFEVTAIRSVWPNITRLWMSWTGALIMLTTAAFLFKIGAEYSRVWLTLWYATGFLSLISTRLIAKRLVQNWTADGRLKRRAAVIGSGHAAEQLIKRLQNDPDAGVEIVGVFDDRNTKRTGNNVDAFPILGNTGDLLDIARASRIDLLIVTLPLVAEVRLMQLVDQLSVLPIDIKIAADTSRVRFRPQTYSYIGDVAMLDIVDRPIDGWDQVLKSVFDRCVGLLALIALSPLMLLTALAIKLDSKGPVLFRQKRYGFNNELIEVFKFRSMYTEMSDAKAAKLVTKDDPRVTPVGRFIRKTSIDELPQLFNVLLGTLSLVGPRPHALQAKAADALYQDVVVDYFARHKVKPGITGWAQVNGWRGETDTAEKIEKRVEHDLYYIENWSVFFDIWILLKTPTSLLNTESAY